MNRAITEEQGTSSFLTQQKIFGSPKKKRLLLALLLFALTLITYDSASHSQFVNYDDPLYITENSHVHQGLHWHTVSWAFTTFELYNWHPLTWISYLADYQLFKLNPTGYHLVNVILHGLNVVLLFLILYRVTGYPWRSLSVALLFAVHPFNIESVAWVSERKNVLSTLFWWLAIWAYGWYALRPGWKRYLTVAALFALGLMAKPMVITLPCVFILLDVWPLRRVRSWSDEIVGISTDLSFPRTSWLRLVMEKIPLFILSALSGVLTIVAQRVNGGMSDTTDYPVLVRVENALLGYATYIWKTFWPINLAIFYPHPGYDIPVYKIILSLLLLVGITVWVVQARLVRPYLLLGWLWFLGTHVPTIGLLQNGEQAMADRYAYIPIAGLFLLIIWGLAEYIGNNRTLALGATALGFAVLILLVAVTRRQLQYWQDSISLFSHATLVTRNNDVAERNLGVALADKRKEEEAAVHFHKALFYNPYNPAHHYNYGRSLFLEGETAKAIRQFNVALEIYNLDTRHRQVGDNQFLFCVHTNLAIALTRKGSKDEAYRHFAAASKLSPTHFLPPLMMGLLDVDRNQIDLAYQEISESVRRTPSDVGYIALGLVLQRQGRFAEAEKAYQQAIAVDPSSRLIKMDIAAIENSLGTQKESIPPTIPAGH